MFWGWNGRRPLWFMGWHREWYPDSISFKCTREWSGNDGGVIGGMLKSSLSRLGPGKDWKKKKRTNGKCYEHWSVITIKVIQNKQGEPNPHTSKHNLQYNREYFQDQYIIQVKAHHYVWRKKCLSGIRIYDTFPLEIFFKRMWTQADFKGPIKIFQECSSSWIPFSWELWKGNVIYKINIGTKWFILLPSTQTKNYTVKKDTTFMLRGVQCIYSARKKKKQYVLSMSILCVYKSAFEIF